MPGRARFALTARMRFGPAAAKSAPRASPDAAVNGGKGRSAVGPKAAAPKAAATQKAAAPKAGNKSAGAKGTGAKAAKGAATKGAARVPAAAKGGRARPAAGAARATAGTGADASEGAAGEGAARRWRRSAPVRALVKVPVELVVLAALALLTRLAFVTSPRAVVFDEVYFREYALRYREGSYFFDIHPPLGKLLLAGWSKLVGVSATAEGSDPAVAIRILPALAGSALIVVFYLLLLRLRAGRKVATLGAGMLLLDNAFLVESRFILVDSMLLLFGLSAILCYLAACERTGRAHWVLLGASGLLAGMAAATKWTGLVALGLIGLLWLVRGVRERPGLKLTAGRGGVLVGVPFLLYVATWAVHFRLLTKSGPGDAYMSEKFQKTLPGGKNYDPDVGMSFLERLSEGNSALHRYDVSLNNATHPYSSDWLSWPLMRRGVYYWTGPHGDGKSRHIYLLGNPFIWWGLVVAVLVVAMAWIARPHVFARRREAFALLGVGWAGAFLPFAAIERPMFLYHYFFAFLFCLAAVAIGVGLLAGWVPPDDGGRDGWAFASPRSACLYWGLLAAALLAFLYFAPLSYGTPLTDAGLADRMWLGKWR